MLPSAETSLLASTVAHIVDFSRRFAVAVAAVALIGALALGAFDVTHFRINTDINQLLSSDLDWRQREADMDAAFPQKTDNLVVVVDGETPELADNAAEALATKLEAAKDRFTFVERPDAIPFFRKNGLLLLPQKELANVLDQLVQAQPMLGTVAADPSLRGFFSAIGLMTQGVQQGETDAVSLEKPIEAITSTLESALAGQDKPLSLENMMPAQKDAARDLRKYILTKPLLDYSALQPGAEASQFIRDTANALKLTPDHGVRVRLTGPVALNDEEFASVSEGAETSTLLSAFLVLALLFIALRSLRLVVPIVLTLLVGLITTTAFALAFVGSLNLISIAFAVMFIGIAVDFGIQFGVRYRDQKHQEPQHAKALTRTARVIAAPLTMAAGATALGFLAFLPTDYRGVSELGLIAGVGMVIAFFLNITLLPALLTLTKPPAEKEAVGYKQAAPVDHFLLKNRHPLLLVAAIMAVGGTFVASRVSFDFDPLNLKNPKTESVSTLLDLMKNPESSPYAISILTPSLEEAQGLSDALQKVPEVDHVMSLATFVPEDQDAKLALINDTRGLLESTLNPPAIQAPPTEPETLDALSKTAAALHGVGAKNPILERLAKALDAVVARHDPALLQRLQKDIVAPLLAKLDAVKQSLNASPITEDSITPDLRKDWVSKDGDYLLQVYPKGDPRDQETLAAFTDAVEAVEPDATGAPISIQESADTITSAFVHAGFYALLAIIALSLLILRRPMDVLRLIAPLVLATVLTLATMALIGWPLNYANIIALPLLLSLGVSYSIYFVFYWRSGQGNPLQSSMARAVGFSAATVLVAFASLTLSTHPGTSGMGKLLTIALLYAVLCTFLVLPALLGKPKTGKTH